MPESVYSQRLNGPLFWLCLAATVAVGAAIAPLLVDGNLAVFIFAFAIFAITAACLFMRVTIRVTDEQVKVSVLGFSYTEPISRIAEVSVGPETGLREGAGPRLAHGATAYIVGGPTVEIKNRTSSYLASAEDPEAVVADIEVRRRLR